MSEGMIPRSASKIGGKTNVTVNCGTEGGGTSFPEAPRDGKLYGRKNAAWSEVKENGGEGGGIPEAPSDGKLYGRKDKAWKEVESGRGVSSHNDLTDVVPDGSTQHLTEDELAWLRTAKNRLPQKPQNLYPVDGEYEVDPFARFVGSNYYQADDVPMGALELEISKGGTVVFGESSYQSTTSYELSGTELEPNETEYSWRIRYQTVEGQWSEWSEATAFKTMSVFEPSMIRQPMIAYPLEGGATSPIDLPLIGSTFINVGESAIHKTSSWRINTQRNGQGVDLWRKDHDAQNLNSIVVPLDLSTAGTNTTLYAGVRYEDTEGRSSRWSPMVGFVPRAAYMDYQHIGFAHYPAARAIVRRLDKNGTPVAVRPEYFDAHPWYKTLSELVVVDGQHMALMLPFYVKCESVEGWTKIYTSMEEQEGYHLHPAFAASPNGRLIGRYVYGKNGSGTSEPGHQISSSTVDTVTNIIAAAVDRNKLGNTQGWRHASYYDYAALKLMLAIAAGSFDPSDTFGYGNVSLPSTAVSNDDQSLGEWRGIRFLWGKIVPYVTEGTSTSSRGNLSLGDPQNPSALVGLGIDSPYSLDSMNSYYGVLSFHSGRNETLNVNYDYLFLPKDLNQASSFSYYNFASQFRDTLAKANLSTSSSYTSIVMGSFFGGSASGIGRLAKAL